ncbi:MAG: multi-sensor signal transduction histidine kinase [Anaerocolumna sp.]|nr:multi-sensor signal transduction histidine kinase [Anaerocolumna sp.]
MGQKMKKSLTLPFKSIRINMIFLFSILILCAVFVFLGISMQVTRKAVIENSTEYTKQLIGQVKFDIDSYISYMENISTMVVTNMDIREYLSEPSLEKDRESILYNRMLSQFDTILNMREDIYNIAIYGENGKYVLNRGSQSVNPNINVKEMSWYKKAIAAEGKRVLSSSHVQNLVYDDYKWVVTLSKAIRTKETGKNLGALLVDLNYSSITKLCQNINMGNKGYIFLIDENGEVIYHPKQQLIYTGLRSERISEIISCKSDHFIAELNGEEKLYTMSTSEKTGWTVVGVANINELFVNREETQTIYLESALLLLLSAFVIAVLFSDKLAKPITALKLSMKEVEKGNFDGVKVVRRGEDEIGMLYNSFYAMTEEIQNLMEDKSRSQKEKYRLELRALQAQINPHFMYNTLDSIVWMAEGGNNKEVVIMTSTLGKLLRQSISNEEEFVTIEREVDYAKSYLIIQKMRYTDQLTFEIEVDPAIYNYKIVKLTLQPLVENAIYHGIKYKETMGKIVITGKETEEGILIQIIDDGIGMEEETLNHIFDKKKRINKNNGVAVENVNRRLKLYYGENYGLQYESKLNVGTIVSIFLPKEMG